MADRLKLQVEALTNNNMSSRVAYENKIFDLVLNLNNLNDVKGGLEKIKENALIAEEAERRRLSSQSAYSSGEEMMERNEMRGASFALESDEEEEEDDDSDCSMEMMQEKSM